ncbi:MAG: hypothetical protein HY302_07760 [Opitutae bacterium]|nr:hypothetical protein [Opitutae bacterium]
MKFLQLFDFKISRYERPNDAWVCGRKDSCEACPLGPDRKGNCRATADCRPRREGDRWQCTRTDTRGGKCASGPRPDGSCCNPIPPCVPQRSVRARRGVAVLLAVAATLGAVLLALGLRARDQVFNPGPRTAHHSSTDITCASCHTAAQISSTEWLEAAFSKKNAHADSMRCLVCHSLGNAPTQPHSLDPKARALLTAKARARPPGGDVPLALQAASFLGGPPVGADGTLACATCHREHHGRSFDLKKLSDASCQACHASTFASLARGHPQFTGYPAERRTRIEFDHAGHLNKYFQKLDQPPQCSDCHVPDAANRSMLVKGFEANCRACHLESITRPGAKGIAVLRIPGFDRKFLETEAATLGAWPADADGDITPFMQVLLAGDANVAKAIAALKGVDLLDLSGAAPETRAAARQLAWGVKELFADLIVSGQETMKKRLGDAPTAAIGQLPAESLNAFTQAGWWPDLLAEVAAHRAGQKLPGLGVAAAPAPAPAKTAPPPAAAAPTAPAATDDILDDAPAKPAAAPAAAPAVAEDILGGDDILTSDQQPAEPAANTVALAGAQTPAAQPADDDIIDDAPAKPAPAPAKVAAKPADDSLGDDIIDDQAAAAPAKKAEPEQARAPERVAPEKWVSAGGWHVAPNDFSLNYRATGHGDPFLQAWLDLGAARATTAAAQETFKQLGANGSCLKCHSVDRAAGESRMVNWKAKAPMPHMHEFTKFSHGAHYNSVNGQSCQTCHHLDAGAKYTAAFGANVNPAQFESNFRQLTVSDCARCHTAKIVGNSCQLCHNYHVGEFMPTKLTGN